MSDIAFNKVSESYGWLGNMSPYQVVYESKSYRTTEALFQALRFNDLEIIEEIRSQKSPMAAKMIAKKYKNKMTLEPLSVQDLNNMKLCLNLKIKQNPELVQKLLDTNNDAIIENCTSRQRGTGLFWGAAYKDGKWTGENHLGKLWMEVREEVKASL